MHHDLKIGKFCFQNSGTDIEVDRCGNGPQNKGSFEENVH